MGKHIYYQSQGVKPQPKLKAQIQPTIPVPAGPSHITPIIDKSVERRPVQVEGCVCNRAVEAVACPCGYFKRGLKSVKPCKIHPNVTYLYDLPKCPYCKEPTLEEANAEDMAC